MVVVGHRLTALRMYGFWISNYSLPKVYKGRFSYQSRLKTSGGAGGAKGEARVAGDLEAHREEDETYSEQLGSVWSMSPVLLHQRHQTGADHFVSLRVVHWIIHFRERDLKLGVAPECLCGRRRSNGLCWAGPSVPDWALSGCTEIPAMFAWLPEGRGV